MKKWNATHFVKKELHTKSLEDLILDFVLIFVLFLSIISIVKNFALGFPFPYCYKWIVISALSAILLFLPLSPRLRQLFKTISLFIVALVVFPLAWIQLNMCDNTTLYYCILFL